MANTKRTMKTRNSSKALTVSEVAKIAGAAASGAVTTAINSFQHPAGVVDATSTKAPKASKAPKAITSGRPGRKPDVNSGLSRARALYAQMNGSDRATIVKAFQDKLSIAKKTANTYFHLAAGPSTNGSKRGRKAKVAGTVNA